MVILVVDAIVLDCCCRDECKKENTDAEKDSARK